MNKAQEIQNEIYRKMSADEKVRIVNDFYEFSRKLQKAKIYDDTKIPQSNQRCLKQA